MPQIDKVLTDFGLPVGPYGMQDIAGIDVGARIRQYLNVDWQVARRGAAVGDSGSPVRDGTLRPEDRRRLVQVRRARQPQPDARSADRSDWRRKKRRSAASRDARSPTRRSSRASRRRSPTRARACWRTASRRAPATSTSSTSTASGSRAIAAGRCSMPTPSACRPCSARVKEYRARFGDYWEPAPLLERLVAEGRGFYSEARRRCEADEHESRGLARHASAGEA